MRDTRPKQVMSFRERSDRKANWRCDRFLFQPAGPGHSRWTRPAASMRMVMLMRGSARALAVMTLSGKNRKDVDVKSKNLCAGGQKPVSWRNTNFPGEARWTQQRPSAWRRVSRSGCSRASGRQVEQCGAGRCDGIAPPATSTAPLVTIPVHPTASGNPGNRKISKSIPLENALDRERLLRMRLPERRAEPERT